MTKKKQTAIIGKSLDFEQAAQAEADHWFSRDHAANETLKNEIVRLLQIAFKEGRQWTK